MFCVGVFCAPQTLADPSSRLPHTWFGADDLSDFTRGGKPAENFSWGKAKTTPAYTAASPAGLSPVAALRAPAQSSCAPDYSCFGFYPQCWYELLNTSWGTSCNPGWVFQNGYKPTVGDPCTVDPVVGSTSLVVFPTAGTFYQDFFVPYDATGALKLDVRYQTLGGGTWWDRVIVELWEGNTRLGISRFPSATDCQGGSYTFFGNFAGKNLRLEVWGSIVTPGVVHRVERIRVWTNLP